MVPDLPQARSPIPLSLEEKTPFILSALPRMAEHTFPFLCSMIGIVDANTGMHFGSGIRCLLQGKRAILTALHVINRAAAEPKGLAISVGYGRRPFVVHGSVNYDPIADLAVYFVPADYPDGGGVTFWPSDRTDRELAHLGTDYLFLHGFPGANSYSSQLLGGVVNRSLPYGAMRCTANLPNDLQSFQFAIEYDPVGMLSATGLPAEMVNPHGLSGSPVWRMGLSGRSSHEWQPDHSSLVGIVTQWRPDQKILVATSVSKIPPNW